MGNNLCCAPTGYLSSGSGDEGPSKSRGIKNKNRISSGPETDNLLQEILEEGYTSGDPEDFMLEYS
jgi:hypothetical protein